MRLRVSAVVLLGLTGCQQVESPCCMDGDVTSPGGAHLTYEYALETSAPLLPATWRGEDDEHVGEQLFFRDWLGTGAAPLAGPDYDRSSCDACHIETSSRPSRNAESFLVALPADLEGRHRFGAQITRRHSLGEGPEAVVLVDYVTHQFVYPDGAARQLRQPVARAESGGEPVPVRLRAASLLFGWGLLEHVDEEMLLNFDDPNDRNGDGISGTARWVRDEETATTRLGRFGWKSTHPSLRQQIATALFNDMGVTSSLRCEQPNCIPEMAAEELAALAEYVGALGVPNRREDFSIEGEILFGTVGCSDCHVPALVTKTTGPRQIADQLIWAYTDLMLHDMGEALAEPGDAEDSREWRTAPLWGIGLVEVHLTAHGFLHDGRAKTIEDAVLWHGGEAEGAKLRFTRLRAEQREALLGYVRAL
ncbi:MAG: di-heme oxidoredictase family protein [Pseudomonadota bacterium]